MVKATFGSLTWEGFAYAGDLVSGAYGYNNHGIAFTLNWLGPRDIVVGGYARGFISRRLLEARDWDEAMGIITMPNHAVGLAGTLTQPLTQPFTNRTRPILQVGHNYQLMDMKHRKIGNIETAPGQEYAYMTVTKPFFHANQYQAPLFTCTPAPFVTR